jgi:hypothetical protein
MQEQGNEAAFDFHIGFPAYPRMRKQTGTIYPTTNRYCATHLLR